VAGRQGSSHFVHRLGRVHATLAQDHPSIQSLYPAMLEAVLRPGGRGDIGSALTVPPFLSLSLSEQTAS
jgi:hypothetical protein